MQILVYDQSFDGLLTALYEAFYLRTLELEIWPRDRENATLFPKRRVPADPEKAGRVARAVLDKLGPESYDTVYCAWLSHREQIEYDIFLYLKLSFARCRNVDDMLQHSWVDRVVKTAATVRREAHRFLGILRFSKFGEVYIADIEPDNDILPLIIGHFSLRFADQTFLIRDLRHGCAAVHREGQTALVPMSEFTPLRRLDGDRFEEMWIRYYKAMGIAERKNPKRMQSFLPKKYWKHLLEREERPG